MRRTRRPTLQRELATLAMNAPQVIAGRSLGMLLSAGQPSAAQRRDMQRMVREKIDAGIEGWWAMAGELGRVQVRWWQQWAQWTWAPWLAANRLTTGRAAFEADMDGILAAGLSPARRRVSSNLRRLRRR